MGSNSILDLITGASPVVQAVMALLLTASLASWALIFRKSRQLGEAGRAAEAFEARFWSGIDLADLYRQLAKREEVAGMEAVFFAGYREFARLFRQNAPAGLLAENVERAMGVAIGRELDRLDQHLPLLATVGSTSPYVGLFGTVWGIMNAFRALGHVQQATLALVAPGIAEALVATAMGLFAAIPAVIAYNRYTSRIDRLERRYERFADEFLCLLQRKALEKP
ncbi:biopolymer transport protein TolQ [Methylomarinovum caldicuralii]|uniref:Tol-Pal system protein TolQ n=1 Tax=Methylomarinovum caldicuralii TaxID=438856 RepID=A0AAU9C9U2_9GAMM|nr:protein TolQ [Methylomarinovum caldicuralii]BCX81259.1 biopolymer transport protein TolQ [Methylomarinovum caldicuralii]